MKPSLVLQRHRAAVRLVIGSYRVRNPRIFGSVLHGTDTEHSDLDILVDPTGETTLFDLGAISRDLNRLLGVPVDVLTPDALPDKARAGVLAEAAAVVKTPAPRLTDYLEHIAAAIERIRRYTTGFDDARFLADELVQDAVIRNLQVIGEACRNIEREQPDFAAAHRSLPLGRAYAMRNALAHGYFRISLPVVWQTLRDDLPPLLQQVRQLLTSPAADDTQ